MPLSTRKSPKSSQIMWLRLVEAATPLTTFLAVVVCWEAQVFVASLSVAQEVVGGNEQLRLFLTRDKKEKENGRE